jgi:YggT family protein
VLGSTAVVIDTLVRFVALGALLVSVTVALTHWGVRSGRLQPFGPWPRFVRGWSDPLLQPLERRLVRLGRNPQEAPLWLVGVVVVAGILLLTLTRWVVRVLYTLAGLRYSGPAAIAAILVDLVFNILVLALLVRVVGSWIGAGRWTRLVMWAYRLTDWIVAPIAKRMPSFGPFDLSPFVAWFALVILRAVVLALL